MLWRVAVIVLSRATDAWSSMTTARKGWSPIETEVANATPGSRLVAGVLQMRKAIFIGFSMFGAAVGLLSSLTESLGVQIVMSSAGCMAGAAIGGGLAGIGRRRQHGRPCEDEATALEGAQVEQVKNYWLDGGRITAAPGLPNPDDTDPHRRQR